MQKKKNDKFHIAAELITLFSVDVVVIFYGAAAVLMCAATNKVFFSSLRRPSSNSNRPHITAGKAGVLTIRCKFPEMLRQLNWTVSSKH